LQIDALFLDERKKREKLATIHGSMNATHERQCHIHEQERDKGLWMSLALQ